MPILGEPLIIQTWGESCVSVSADRRWLTGCANAACEESKMPRRQSQLRLMERPPKGVRLRACYTAPRRESVRNAYNSGLEAPSDTPPKRKTTPPSAVATRRSKYGGKNALLLSGHRAGAS